jgi:hypothetical protein
MERLHMYETTGASIPLDHKRNIHYCENVKFHVKNFLYLSDFSIHRLIQGVPGGMCQTSGGCSLC